MQIIAGLARGLQLSVPEGMSVRPTGVRARKALFDSLRVFDGLFVVDLFAGSGALGLEAASRGAARVLFVERDRKTCRLIEENIARVARSGITCQFKVLCADASNLIPPPDFVPDLIFADPPYAESARNFAALTANTQFSRWGAGARLVWELPESKSPGLPPPSPPWRSELKREFGGISFLFLRADTLNQ